jgi:cyclic pyranopterin phosphate synthase
MSPHVPSSTDTLGRALRDLRLSVTDRCNFRCTYCMPKEVFGRDHAFLPKADILSFEELARIARVFVGLGVEKIRVTGGEPLLRRNLPTLIEMLAGIDGLRDLTLTTNGSALPAQAQALRDAGLQRITVSLDALDDAIFRSMNDVDFPVARVLEGIEAARSAGLSPIKVNMVVKRGVNEHQMVPMLKHFAGTGVIVRFIEFMDVGSTNGWRLDDVFSAQDMLSLIGREMKVKPIARHTAGDVAERFQHEHGEFGIIASVTRPFCRGCTRARVSAEGKLHTCLFGHDAHDLRALLRGGLSDESIRMALSAIWSARGDRYSEIRSSLTDGIAAKPEMSAIGG